MNTDVKTHIDAITKEFSAKESLIFDASAKLGVADSLFSALVDALDLESTDPNEQAAQNFVLFHARMADMCSAIRSYLVDAKELLDMAS